MVGVCSDLVVNSEAGSLDVVPPAETEVLPTKKEEIMAGDTARLVKCLSRTHGGEVVPWA